MRTSNRTFSHLIVAYFPIVIDRIMPRIYLFLSCEETRVKICFFFIATISRVIAIHPCVMFDASSLILATLWHNKWILANEHHVEIKIGPCRVIKGHIAMDRKHLHSHQYTRLSLRWIHVFFLQEHQSLRDVAWWVVTWEVMMISYIEKIVVSVKMLSPCFMY